MAGSSSENVRRRAEKFLTDEEIEQLLNQSDVDVSDDEDTVDYFHDSSDDETDSGDTDTEVPRSKGQEKDKRRDPLWKVKDFPARFADSPVLPEVHSNAPSSAFNYFKKYFPESFWKLCADQTNLYSVQVRAHRSVKTTSLELQKLAGIHMIMSLFGLPRARLYWSSTLAVPLVTENMVRDRFFELRSMLHFVDVTAITEAQSQNKLFRAEPIFECFRKACLELPRPEKLSIDEQMIPFSGRCPARQYVPSKPNPVGLKNFVLATTEGLVLDFVIYTGKGTVPDHDLKELGLGGAVVKRLLETVPTEQPVQVFTDRFFTGLKLADFLIERNIYLTGTVMSNRTGGAAAKLPSDKEMARGDSCCVVRNDDKVCITKWKDKKGVTLLSAALGISPEGKCKRWSKEEGKKVEIPQPACVKAYNTGMGGVDLTDRYVSYYRTKIRTKKWTIRVFAHFLDLATINSWIEYRSDCKRCGVARKDTLDLFEFKSRIAEALIRSCPKVQADGEEDALESDEESESAPPARKQRKVVPLPVDEVRFDMYGHFPEHVPCKSQMRCRNPGCTGKSRIRCTKCALFFCLQNRNCFRDFHTSKT
ncbi:piggyBac transposable element-derived protein 2-like [Ixodes scapularis]|uniref:piggyBac transposable element-derived protein 2-like n=1 Tax=Ixodes scapularis TaxID=6945 RepID=UPI0011615E02|nr:piggyBac transposable element-derived protein 2-like [Ixodes scapularis]